MQSKPRRPRIHFNPTLARIHEMGLIQQGYPTLAALHRFRYLTSWQVAKLLFLGQPNLAGRIRGPEAARKAANERCLRRLKDRHLVEARQAMLRHGHWWKRQEYNVLTQSGHLLLSDHLSIHGENLPEWQPERHAIAPEALAHALAINDVGISLSRSCDFHGWRLRAWLDDLDSRLTQGASTPGQPIPDAVALVACGQHQRLYFIEVDRGTEPIASASPNSWRTKMLHYRHYLADGFARDPFFTGQPQPLLLALTTSPHRLTHLLEETRLSGPVAACWLSLSAWIEPPYDLLGPVWRRPHGGEQFVSLIDEMALASAYGTA